MHEKDDMLSRFFKSEPASGILLVVATVLALLVANSSLFSLYEDTLYLHIAGLSVEHWVNDGLMAIFFLLVGLEIKREMIGGELSTWGSRVLPGVAAAGGMALPALIFLAITHGRDGITDGWAIPTATDIAFATIGYLLGRLIPNLFVPVLAAAIVFLLFQLPSMLRPQHQPTFWLDSIVPTKLTQAMAPYIGDQVDPRFFWSSLAWFFSLVAVVVSILSLWRIRKVIPVVLLAASLIASSVSAVAVVRAYDASGSWHANHRGEICIEHTGILFCSPPAAMGENDLQATAAAYDELIPAWLPSNLLPEKFAVAINGNQLPTDTTEMVPLNRGGADRTWMEMNVWIAIVSGVTTQLSTPTAAQFVIACVMLRAVGHDCGPSYPNTSFQKIPDLSQSREGQAAISVIVPSGPNSIITPPSAEEQAKLEQDMTTLQQTGETKLDDFLALSDADKAAWLTANWGRLHAGDLTLEDLP